MSGYLYILSNAAFPNLLKVGQTSESPEVRIRQLNSTGVPFPFLLEACLRLGNPKKAELIVHKALEHYRASQNREFFKIDLKSTLDIILPLILTQNISLGALHSDKAQELSMSEEELNILQRIVHGGIEYGVSQYRLYEDERSSRLSVEVVLSRLEQKKFVKCDRRGGVHEVTWVPTTKGIKYLYDNDLIEEWMRR